MAKIKKSGLLKHVADADAAKKVNPLDLSSDQDLTIALMNLIHIIDLCADNGDVYGVGKMLVDMTDDLMSRIVDKGGKKWDSSRRLLAESMNLMVAGNKAMDSGQKAAAHKLYDDAYEQYSLFWGVNMGIVDC